MTPTESKSLNREILRLSVPSILANITVPLVGMVDTAIAGHITGGDSAALIGAISIGSTLFTLLYWSFGFLRTGTGGLTAQAFGADDATSCRRILLRGASLALLVAIVTLIISHPFAGLVVRLFGATPKVEEYALQYFFVRIFAAPATFSLMAFRGWFIGMQDAVSSMWADLIINFVNIAASLLLCFGVGEAEGMGFDGIALGTVIAQYSGLFYCVLRCKSKYRGSVFPRGTKLLPEVKHIFHDGKMREFFAMNANLLGRSFFFICIYVGYTAFAAREGDLLLSASSIIMQLMMLFSYFTDGFAYAGEALTGRFIGERNRPLLRAGVKYVFVWSLGITLIFMVLYRVAGEGALRLLTSDEGVIETCSRFLPWLILMPPLGCAAFTWDGVFLGATSTKALRNAMGGAAVFFFVVMVAGKHLLATSGDAALHLLLAAYFAHLLFRTAYLSATYKGQVLSKV